MLRRAINLVNVVLVAWLVCSGFGCKNQRSFQVNGVVREVLPDGKRVKIEHEAIPTYMAAMTMTFDVKETNELMSLQAGDKVSFRMIVRDKDGWIEQIKKTGPATPVVAAATETFRAVREVEPLK